MGVPAGAPDGRALLAGSPRVRAVVPDIVRAAEDGQRVALVGGVVRDLVRGEEPREVDLVVEGDAIAFARRLGRLLGARVRAHPAFGTATIASRPPIDVAMARTEVYAHPGALPQVRSATIDDDLARRDLTVNAIAVVAHGPDAGAVLDPHGGIDDLRAGRLRLIAPHAFEEDATRLIRVARYADRLGLEPDALLEQTARHAATGGFVPRVGRTRIGDALRLVFGERHPANVVRILSDFGVWDALGFGDGPAPDVVARAFALAGREAEEADRVAIGFGLLVAASPADARRPMLQDFGLERERIRRALAVADAGTLAVRLGDCGDGDLDALCARVPVEAVVAAGALGDDLAERAAERYLGDLRHRTIDLDGDDVARVLGIDAGPAIGRALQRLRRARIDGAVGAGRAAQEAWLRDFT